MMYDYFAYMRELFAETPTDWNGYRKYLMKFYKRGKSKW